MTTEQEWKNFVRLATELERETPILGGIAARERGAVLAAYQELKERREDEEWIKDQFRGDKLHHLGLRYSNRDNKTYFTVAMENDSDGEGDTIHAAITAAKEAAK